MVLASRDDTWFVFNQAKSFQGNNILRHIKTRVMMQQVHIKSSCNANWNFQLPASSPRRAAKAALAQLRQHLGGTREALRRHTLLVRVGPRHYRLPARDVPRSLRAGGGDTQHFFFISDIEGCYDFYRESVDSIANYKESMTMTNPTLCILGDIPDRNDIATQINVYENEDYGLCRNRGTVGTVLQKNFGEKVVRILGNRDGNKARFKNEPCKLKNYPDFGGLSYCNVNDMFAKTLGMSVDEFVEDPDNFMCKKFKPKFDDLKSCYLRYIQHAQPCAKLAEGLFCAHGCPPTNDIHCQAYNDIYQTVLKIPPGLDMKSRKRSSMDSYDKNTDEVDYKQVPERFFADICADHAKTAWRKAAQLTEPAAPIPDNGGPVLRKPASYKAANCDMQLESLDQLKGVVGHQPVGYFPHMRNGLLCIDVSAANEQGFRGTNRESMPMIHLEFTNNTTWKIHVKVKIPTDGTRFYKTKPEKWTEDMNLESVLGESDNVEYEITPDLLNKQYTDKDDQYKTQDGKFLVGSIKNGQHVGKLLMIETFPYPRHFEYKYSISDAGSALDTDDDMD